MTYNEFMKIGVNGKGVVVRYGDECKVLQKDKESGYLYVLAVRGAHTYKKWFHYSEIG